MLVTAPLNTAKLWCEAGRPGFGPYALTLAPLHRKVLTYSALAEAPHVWNHDPYGFRQNLLETARRITAARTVHIEVGRRRHASRAMRNLCPFSQTQSLSVDRHRSRARQPRLCQTSQG